MNAAYLGLVLALLPGDQPRPPHPLAPSLPQLSDEEEERIDKIIDHFILADTGKLQGAEARRATTDFHKLGPEATPALLRSLNRAAAIEHSCPALVIAKKLARTLNSTTDLDLLEYARETIGAGVTAQRHMGVLKDLRVTCMLRKRAVLEKGIAFKPELKTQEPRMLSVSELAQAAGSERGERLKTVLLELGKRKGDEALAALGSAAAATYDPEIRNLARDQIRRKLAGLSDAALKDKLKDDRAEIRAAAAQAVGAKGLRYGSELIDLLKDEETVVWQAARAALVKLGRGSDFGPADNADATARAEAAAKWRAWWQKQGGR
jgi:hypothetical protein